MGAGAGSGAGAGGVSGSVAGAGSIVKSGNASKKEASSSSSSFEAGAGSATLTGGGVTTGGGVGISCSPLTGIVGGGLASLEGICSPWGVATAVGGRAEASAGFTLAVAGLPEGGTSTGTSGATVGSTPLFAERKL